MKPKTPKAISHGHENLCSELNNIKKNYNNLKDELGNLDDIMGEHFRKEEKYALPPLGLLLTLAEGNWQVNEETAIEMSNAVNAKYNELKTEHEHISDTLEKIKKKAEKENFTDILRFAHNLEIHMELEDQVLYPTALLIGNYFTKLKNE